MEIIQFNVCHQEICTDREKLVSDTIGSYKCHFNFDSSWDGLNKVAVFVKGKNFVEMILDSNNECDFADELLDTTGTIVIGAYGTKDGVRYPTIKSKMLIVREGIVDGVQPTPPSLEIWEQLLNKIEEERQRAISKENALENGLNAEIERAKNKENLLNDLITAETNRAKSKENELAEQIEQEAEERKTADNEFTRDLDDVHNLIDGLDENKAEKDNTYTKAEVNQLIAQATPADYDEVKAQVETNKTNIETINGLIPSQASEENQLADKEFVNSSIATNTATFIGTFNSVAELEAYEGVKTNNDYAFVIINDETTGFVKEYDRYKWNGTQWLFEYSLNNSSFTAQQWATINSGLTSQDVEDLHNALVTIEQIQTELANKMERIVLYLSQVNNVWNLKNEDGESVSFQELYNHCRNKSHYVVVLVGNSKLRPQYVSVSEIHCDGEDRDSQGSLFMRMIMTPSNLYYQTFRQAEVSDLVGKANINLDNLNDSGKQEIKDIIFEVKYRLVKEGLIDNNIVLTDEEKLKIETWLGLSENYLTYYNEMPYQVNGDYVPTHKKYVDGKLVDKQETLRSGINIKTINNESILGSGNINVGSITDDEVPLLLDGTISTYRKVMKQWFLANGVKVVTPLGLTDLVTRWYTITRDNWSGGVKFYQPTSTQGATGQSTGIAIGDNIGLNCSPSTDTIKGTDNYEGLPLFAITDCNWAMNGDEPLITAIDGITDNFVRDSEDNLVGVLQMNGYHSYDEDDEFYTHTYSSNYEDGHSECAPLPESVAIDGSVRPYVVHAKYMAYWNGQKYTCCAGVIPTAWQSHDIAVSRGKASGISGGCLVDYAFLKLMYHLKYKNLASDGVLQGCCNYNYQRYAIVSETNTNRVLLSSGRVSEFEVGSSVLIGAYNGSTDRNNSGCYNISGQSGRKVLKVENVNINGTTYTQVVVDGNPFNTVASTSDTTATTGATIISSFHYETGYCDSVLGNDGSPKNVTSGKYPARLQGIEYAVGGYEVFADTIQNHNGTEYEVYTCDRLANQGTSISTHKASGLKIPMPASNNWYYPKKWGYKDGIFYPTVHGTSSSQFLKDGFYMLGTGQTDTKEFLSFGTLNTGSGIAGLSCLSGFNALSTANWHILVRLSPNSNRGEFVA